METTTILSDNLIAGAFPRIEKFVTILANEGALKRGTIVTRNGDGKFRKYNTANDDGSEILQVDPCVLAIDIAASVADTTGVLVYQSGEFFKALVQDPAHTNKTFDADEIDTLRDKGIYLKNVYGSTI